VSTLIYLEHVLISLIGDATKLSKDFGIKMKGKLELVDVARYYDPDFRIPGRYISLANIVAKYLGKEMCKGPVRTSNWEAALNEEQMECGSLPTRFISSQTYDMS
jgi:hypothetical protein